MITVRFIKVGRDKKSWIAELPSTDLHIAREARKALRSRNVTAADGVIYAGWRIVGQYRILPPSESLSV